jgi:hypothetical protein
MIFAEKDLRQIVSGQKIPYRAGGVVGYIDIGA